MLIFSMLLLLGVPSCAQDASQEENGTKPEPPSEKPVVEQVEVVFDHPCAYVNAEDLDRVCRRISGKDESDPVYASWLEFSRNEWAQETIRPSALETVVRGDPKGTGTTENYIICARQAAAAFQLALRWKLSGDEKYAESARAILNEWALVNKRITANDSNQYLLAGFQGYTFANAAELLRDYGRWTSTEQGRFKTWLKEVWYTKNHWFLENHGGPNVCDLHYWSNWELANLASVLAIGIYLEDQEMVNEVNTQFLSGKGSGALSNLVPFDPVPDPDGSGGMIAQCMESGRDQGHATLCVSLVAELCRMAQNIGLDFWGADGNRVLAMAEYVAKYNVRPEGAFLPGNMPFNEYRYCMGCSCGNQTHGAVHSTVSANARGKERPGWELIRAHYVREKELPESACHYSALFAAQLRYRDGVLTGDGGAGDLRYGTASGAFDQLGWGTLLFYDE